MSTHGKNQQRKNTLKHRKFKLIRQKYTPKPDARPMPQSFNDLFGY
jgi:hypothetical protein